MSEKVIEHVNNFKGLIEKSHIMKHWIQYHQDIPNKDEIWIKNS